MNNYFHYNEKYIKNDEEILRNKLKNLLNYSELLFYSDFYTELNLNKQDMIYHIDFVIKKLNYYSYILKKYLEKELDKEKNLFICVIDFKNFFNMYINNDNDLNYLNNMLINLNKLKNNIN